MKDVNSKQKEQNFNLWAIMHQVKQSCRLELRHKREFRPGAFNQWTSSVSDPNLNDISDRSFAETLISGGIKKGSWLEGISDIYGKTGRKEKYEKESIMKRGYEKPKEILLLDFSKMQRGGKSRANSHGIAKSIIRAIFTDRKL